MGAKSIAFINFKGGVGKTSTVVNIGAILAKQHGKKVLIVDLDPQCNSSLWLLQYGLWKKHISDKARSTYQIFDDKLNGTSKFDFLKAVLTGVPYVDGFPLIAKLDLLPASVELLRLEGKIPPGKQTDFFKSLHKAIEPYRNHYDYIFFDCAPNLYSITKSALFAADYCVVPYLPDYLSLSGFEILSNEVSDFYEQYASSLPAKKKPGIAALIVSHFRLNVNVQLTALNELDQQAIILREKKLVLPFCTRLQPNIRFNVDVAESTNEHLPVIIYRPQSIGAQDYLTLTEHFLTHFQEIA